MRERSLTSAFNTFLLYGSCLPVHVFTGGWSARRRAPGLSVRPGSVPRSGSSGLFLHLPESCWLSGSQGGRCFPLLWGRGWNEAVIWIPVLPSVVLWGFWTVCKIRVFTGRCRFLSFGYLCFLLEVCLCVTRISSSVCSSTYEQHMRCEEETWYNTLVREGEEVQYVACHLVC